MTRLKCPSYFWSGLSERDMRGISPMKVMPVIVTVIKHSGHFFFSIVLQGLTEYHSLGSELPV